MKVLVACEFSGVVRRAFEARRHAAWSCDLLPADDGSTKHFQCDVREVLGYGWDMIIAHPPCTLLTRAGARWWAGKEREQDDAVSFFMEMYNAPAHLIAVENPIGIMSSRFRKPDQIVQPWQFGVGEVKATCFWLKNLPPLIHTKVVSGRYPAVHYAAPGPDRWKRRSITCQGIADAMADQWGSVEAHLYA